MNTTIKICGLSTSDTVEAAVANGADLVGFIFFEKSPRHLEVDRAQALRQSVTGRALSVAATVNADNSYLEKIIKAVDPDFLQLHGTESPERCRVISEEYDLPIIKAFAIRDSSDLERLKPYEGKVDRFLLDAKAPAGSRLPGGNGISFDWSLLEGLSTQTPWMLSGGLDAGNVGEALTVAGVGAIDVSSGVESAPGIKDVAKIRAFIKTVRAFDTARDNYSAAV